MTRRALLSLLILLPALGCDDSPTSPTDPNVARFTAILLPGNEVPAVTNADAAASGTMQMTMTAQRDSANNIIGATYDITIHLTGFPTDTVLTGAHIHNAPAGANAGVVVGVPLSAGETALPTGQGTLSKTGLTAQNPANAAAVAQSIFNNPAGNYFNVHTSRNTPGAVRGQLVRAE